MHGGATPGRASRAAILYLGREIFQHEVGRVDILLPRRPLRAAPRIRLLVDEREDRLLRGIGEVRRVLQHRLWRIRRRHADDPRKRGNGQVDPDNVRATFLLLAEVVGVYGTYDAGVYDERIGTRPFRREVGSGGHRLHPMRPNGIERQARAGRIMEIDRIHLQHAGLRRDICWRREEDVERDRAGTERTSESHRYHEA